MDQLDQQAVTLAKAIRQTESGGDFSARGKSGEFGAYQFTEPTWNNYASQYGVNVPLAQATPQQQNEVAYKKIKEWKDKGYNVGQISSMWNAGDGEPEAYKGTFSNGQPSVRKGVKGKVDFSVPDYAHSVASAYQQYKQGNSNPIITPNASSVNQPTGLGGTNPQDKIGEKIIDNSATRYIASKVPSAGTVGSFLGDAANYFTRGFTDLAAIPVQAGVAGYNKLTGSNVQDPFRNGIPGFNGKTNEVNALSDIKGKAGSALEVAGTTGAVAGAGGTAKMFAGPNILKNKTVMQAFENYLGKGETVSKLSALQKAEALENAMHTATAGEKVILEKTLDILKPQILKESGLTPGLMQKLAGMIKGHTVDTLSKGVLGYQAGSLISKLFK